MLIESLCIIQKEILRRIPKFRGADSWSRGWTAEDMDRNIQLFSKSKYIDRSVKELVDNCVRLSRQVKHEPTTDMHTPLPRIEESPSMMEEEMRRSN
jgi:hypothetical protein